MKKCIEYRVEGRKTGWTTKKDMVGACRSGHGRT